MKRNLLRSLFVTLMVLIGANAWADEITATLVHTASSGVPSATAGAYVSTIDAENEYINNGAFGNKNWQGAAYAEFSFEIPAGHVIQSASMVWKGVGSSKDRTTDVLYVNTGLTLDYTATGLGSGTAEVNLGATKIETVTFPKNTTKEFTTDVTNAVKAVASSQSYIIFKFTNNVGSGNLVGKGATSGAPTLVITTTDASSQTKYTVKFTDGTNEIKDAVDYDVTIGSDFTASSGDMASFIVGDKKYIYVSGNTTSTAVADATSNVITLVFREAAIYNYTISSNLGTTLTSATGFEGEIFSAGYPRYQLIESKLYEAPVTNKEYRKSIDLSQDNVSVTVDYTEKEGINAVFFIEAENIAGVTVTTTGNIPVRASNAKGATTEEAATITNLPAGKYKFHAGIFTSKASGFDALSVNIGIGEESFSAVPTGVNLNEIVSDEFTLRKETAIKFLGQSSIDVQFDYIWIEKTGDVEVADPNDYTSYIVNADLTGEGGFDATGTKGISGGIVKVANASAFDFKQTIANLPAGKYKVTAQAAYRFGADEAAEATAITAGTDTKLVQLYATVGEKTVTTKVQNRYDGASETDYANGSGSVTVNEKFVPNSSDAVKAWFAAGKYVNEVTFNLPADGAVTIGINRTGTPESDYTVIGPWTLTRLGDAEVEPEPAALLANGDFEGEFTVFASPKADRDIYQPAGWTVTYENGEENDMTALNSECKSWDNFSGKPQLGETGGKNNFWVRFRWGNSEKLTLSQKVTLAAGNYKLSADAFFNGANGASATISAAGQSAAIAGNSTWANHSVIFNLAEETEVTIALNVTQTQQVENIAAFDNVKLEAIEDIYADLKAEVATALETKQSVKTKTALETALATFTAEQNETNVDALKAALASAKTSINSYKILETGIIPDDKLDGWTCTNTNTFHINTWSGEGNSDGSNMKTPFIENWCNKNDGFLGTGEIYYSLPGLDPGIYSFSALIRAYSEAGNAPTGASLFAQNREKEFATGHSFVYNGMKGIYDTYTMSAEVGEDGVFKFGIKIAEERNFNWMAFKNCRVAYVGAAITEEAVNELATTMPEGKMNADVKKAAEDAIAAAKATIGIETYEAAQVAIAAAKVSVEAYAAANETLAKMKQFTEETNVYTAEALASYYTQWTEKYEANTLTTEEANALQDPYAQTGWQHDANMMIDDLLLSAWSIGEAKAKDYETALYINTWSIEGNNDGSDFKVPFFEYWTNDDKSLAENTLTATLNGVEPGKYDVTAWVRVRAKNGYEAPATGITMQANDGEAVNVAAGDQVGTSQFFLKEFTATGTVAENGVLKIKFNVAADNNISWLSFKNVMVTKNLGEPIFTLNAKVGDEVSIKPGVYDEFDVFTVDFGDGVLVTDSVGHQNKGVCFNDGTETWPQKEGTIHTGITEFKGTVAGDGTIKVYGNSDIWYLAVTGATLAVDQPKLKKVVQFTMSKVAVESLDLTGLDNMEIFSFSQGSLKNINVKNNAALTKLTINNNTASAFESTLESLDLSGNANLEELNVMAASATKPGVLKTLDLSANTKLTNLYAQYNALESVILPENAALSFANLQNNKIAAIDLSKVASLKDTYLNNNLLTEVDLSKVVAGANLYLDGNQLTTVNVPVIVKNLQLNDNKLTSATIAGATASCKLENNAFTLATLPAQPAGLNTASKTKKFTYAPQAAMQVAETVSELDLTSQLTVAKGELNPETVGEAAAYTTWLENQTTSFSFVTAGGNALVEGTDYEVVEPGKFKFLKAQEEKVHAVMLNAAFPKFTEAAPFTTTEFTVEAATGEEFEEVKVTYALKEGETHVSADVVEVKNEDKVVATITYGEAGGAEFKAGKADAHVEGFEAFTEGNGTNGDKTSGTFYTIVPKFDGKIDVAVVLNADKKFYILEDGTALADFDGITVSEKKYGTFTFDVKAEKAYKIYAAGTKLGFYGFNYTYKQAKQPEVTELELTLNVERYTGMGYGATEATVDFTEAKAFLGVEAITEDMLSVLNPDGNAISDFKPYDGWFNGEGVAETWGDNTKINVKFFEAIAGEGKYSICDMNGADEVGKTYSVKWQLAANGKKVIYTINVTFVAAPEFKPEIVKTIDVPVYMTAEVAYEELTAQFDAAEVATALNIASIADAKAYIVNVTTGSFVENTTDGWRDANGDATQWANATNGLCAKIQDPASGTIDYLGTHDANFMENDTYTAKWGFVANEKAVVLNINITFKSAAFMTRINSMKSDSQQGTIYNLNGQKVNKAQKGLNIINGKKIVIK